MKKLKLGIIGCGVMNSAHEQGYLKLQDILEVVGTADIIRERAQAAADALGARMAVEDYHELLDEVDAVFIVLPHDLHHPVAMDCLQAGKHVLIEKPLANSEEQCLEMIDEARRRDLVLMTAYPVRFHPLIVEMKRLVDEQKYGECFQMSLWTEQFTRYEEGHWGLSAERLGGGQFFSHGCHYIDLMCWFLGRPVKGVHIGTNKGTPWMEREGTSQVVIEFESGALGYHGGTWGARGTKLGYSFHAHCTGGMLEVNFTDNKLYLHRDLQEERAETQLSSTEVLMELDEKGKQTHHEIKHFVECVNQGLRPLTDGPVSIQGLRIIWKLYEAERAGVMADLTGFGLEDPWDLKALS